MKPLKVIIVDDEQKAIKNLKNKVASLYPDFEFIKEIDYAPDAIEEILNLKPNIVFLDIEMPEINGLQILEHIHNKVDSIIFTTAYNQHAIEAMNNHASGYLLKPIDMNMLQKVVDHEVEKIMEKEQNHEKLNLIDKFTPSKKVITIATQSTIEVINISDILYISGEQGYTKVHLEGNEMLSSKRIGHFKELLESQNFMHIHKSYIINLDKIIRYNKEGYVVLKNEIAIPISKNKRNEFLEILSQQ